MLRRRDLIGWTMIALCMAWPFSLSGADMEPRGSRTAIADLEVQVTRVDWHPQAEYERLVLTVAGPGDVYIQREFGAGETPSFSSLDFPQGHLSDGVYAYELRATLRSGQELRETGDASQENGLPRSGKLPERPLVQSGHLWVQGGNFVAEKPAQPSPPRQNLAPKDIVQNDDLIVQGEACIGSECVDGDADNGALLTLKQTFGKQLRFEPGSCCYPTETTWALQAGDASEVNGDFTIRNLTFGTTIPFRVGATAPGNALTIFHNGNIGLGTLTPGAKLHLFGSATSDVFGSAGPDPVSGPAFNFGYGGASFGRGAGFLNVRPDASASAPNPSLRFLTANVERMIITNTGNVGIGTTNPAAAFHVNAGEVRFPPGAGAAGATHFNFVGDGKNYIRGTTIIADNSGSVGIGTTAPSSKLHVNGGDIRVSNGSFIDDGVTLNAPDYVFEPDYRLMPLAELKEFVIQEKHLPNIPNAHEVKQKGLNLSQFQMRLLEKVEELTLYTVTQDERLTAQQEELLRLRDQNAHLQERLAALERALPAEKPE